MSNSLLTNPLLRYGLVGIVTNLVIFAGYLMATFLGIDPIVAMTLTYTVGAFVGFLGNRKWVFRLEGSVTSPALRFVAAHMCGYLLNYLILFTFVEKLVYPHQWVQASSILVVAGFLFLLFKFWVFRKNDVICK